MVQVARRLFSVDDYYRMVEAGILHEDDRVELIEGEIVEMPPIGSHHASVVDRLAAAFMRGLGEHEAVVRVQGPVRLDDRSEPVPDVSLLKPRQDFYAGGHPGAADVLPLVEVSDTSIEYDRGEKQRLYSRADIREFWIVDLTAAAVEVYREPSAEGYRSRRLLAKGNELSPEAFSPFRITVEAILG